MRLRFRIRTRSLLVAIALLCVPLGYLSNRWNHGEFEFQRRHRHLAIAESRKVGQYTSIVTFLREHDRTGHSCPICQYWTRGRPIGSVIAEYEQKRLDGEREIRWHLRWVGSSFRWPRAEL